MYKKKLCMFLLGCIAASNCVTAKTNASHTDYKYYMALGGGRSIHSEKVRTFVMPNISGANAEGYKTMTPKAAWIGRVAAGTYLWTSEFNKDVRVEAEYSYHNFYKVSGEGSFNNAALTYKYKIKTQTFFANLYFSPYSYNRLSPYISFGLGAAYNDLDTMKAYTKSDNTLAYAIDGGKRLSFAYNAGAGLRYNINDRFEVDLSYKYANLGKPKSKERIYLGGTQFNSPQLINNKLKTHQLTLSGIVCF